MNLPESCKEKQNNFDARTEKDVYRSVNQLHNLLEEKDLMLYD